MYVPMVELLKVRLLEGFILAAPCPEAAVKRNGNHYYHLPKLSLLAWERRKKIFL